LREAYPVAKSQEYLLGAIQTFKKLLQPQGAGCCCQSFGSIVLDPGKGKSEEPWVRGAYTGAIFAALTLERSSSLA
jgi:hypothetical protein